MRHFFQAQSVVVIGVSNAPNNLGRAIVHNLMEFGFNGCIYLVGSKPGAFLGHKIYSRVSDIQDKIDVAAILVPASAVPAVLRECGEKGIRRVVIETAGFEELGEDRLPLQEELRSILEKYEMRMVGPNCIGVMNSRTGLALPFMPFRAETPPGRIAIVSQSGGIGVMMFNALARERIGFSKFASIGNKLNVDEVDLLDYLVDDDETDIIYCYLEGVSEGRRLMEIACRSQKPIIMHKSNRRKEGAEIARSHSASLSADDQVLGAALEQAGMLRVHEQREAVERVKGCMMSRIAGNRLAIISRSGGHAVTAVDAADEYGFSLPPYPDELTQLVREHSRAKVIQTQNPLDLGDLFDFSLYLELAKKVLALDDFDGLLFCHTYQGVFDAEESHRLMTSLDELIRQSAKPVAVCLFTAPSEMDHNREMVNFPVFTDPREALRALALNSAMRKRAPLPFSTERPVGMDLEAVRMELEGVSDGPIPAPHLARILAACGINVISWRCATTEDEAVAASVELGFPVALKTAQVEVIHKSDVGGVHLHLADEASVRAAYRRTSALGPSVLLQKMESPDVEWFIGGRQDKQFGPVIVSGPGGIYVEILKETGIRVAPVTHAEAARLIDDSRAASLLGGVRGKPAMDRDALIDLTVRVSWMLTDFPMIRELDLNPVGVSVNGCYALDWRAVKGRP